MYRYPGNHSLANQHLCQPGGSFGELAGVLSLVQFLAANASGGMIKDDPLTSPFGYPQLRERFISPSFLDTLTARYLTTHHIFFLPRTSFP